MAIDRHSSESGSLSILIIAVRFLGTFLCFSDVAICQGLVTLPGFSGLRPIHRPPLFQGASSIELQVCFHHHLPPQL